jgi:hypothetical protein
MSRYNPLPCVRFLGPVVVSVLLTGCPGSVSDTGGETLDMTRAYRDPPEGGIQLVTPDLVIEPYSETFWCYYGTYTGETVGVNFLQPFVSAFNHHTFIQAAHQNAPADGTVENCEDIGGMDQTSPLFEFSGTSLTSDGNYLPLPENSAIKFQQGQRWIIEAHFINPTPNTLIVNTAFNLGFVPYDEVEVWVGSWQFDIGNLLLPAEEETTLTFDCDFKEEVSLLTLVGHMHEHGRNHVVELLQGNAAQTLYSIDEWEAEFREFPPISSWEPGDLPIGADDLLRTHCTYENSGEEDLQFPQEMCTTKGLALGLEDAVFCVNGLHMER